MTKTTEDESVERKSIKNRAEAVSSNIEFLEILGDLLQEVERVPELRDKDLETFLTIVHENLEVAAERPTLSNIELPDQPSWSWLARVFIMGTREN